MSTSTLALGQRVRFTQVLHREEVDTRPDEEQREWPVRDDRYQLHWLPKEALGAGILVGYRTLQNGWTSYSREDGNEWMQTGHVRAALVVTALHLNPVRVPLDALIPIE